MKLYTDLILTNFDGKSGQKTVNINDVIIMTIVKVSQLYSILQRNNTKSKSNGVE